MNFTVCNMYSQNLEVSRFNINNNFRYFSKYHEVESAVCVGPGLRLNALRWLDIPFVFVTLRYISGDFNNSSRNFSRLPRCGHSSSIRLYHDHGLCELSCLRGKLHDSFIWLGRSLWRLLRVKTWWPNLTTHHYISWNNIILFNMFRVRTPAAIWGEVYLHVFTLEGTLLISHISYQTVVGMCPAVILRGYISWFQR